MILTVLTEPDPRLRKKSKEVESLSPEILQLMNDMVDTMIHEEGVGLAAPQVNVRKRIVVIQHSEDEDDENAPLTLYKMINPRILERSEDEFISYKEGCLSVPGERVPIDRYARIKVEYWDESFQRKELIAEDILSVCIQHEIDHLDGKLIVDFLSPLKKEVVLKRLKKHKDA